MVWSGNWLFRTNYMAKHYPKSRNRSGTVSSRVIGCAVWTVIATTATCFVSFAQQASQLVQENTVIRGSVHNSAGEPIANALVRLEQRDPLSTIEAKTDQEGYFKYPSLSAGSYLLSADTPEFCAAPIAVTLPSREIEPIDLVLSSRRDKNCPGDFKAPVSSTEAMEFADKPTFTIAGVTDWTAAGGHGSDVSLRASEALTRETLTLKPGSGPSNSPSATHVHSAEGVSHRLAGERDEKSGDPLTAVHEFEQAVRLDPNEQNYFEWGSELLLHRAIWQARDVFEQGAKAFPASARMRTALGTALFTGALYNEAAQRLCEASDLDPYDPEPYIFMGKIAIAAPSPLPCVEQKLARFVNQEPANALANYFYAMALWKGKQPSTDRSNVESLLKKAVALDGKCSEAYLQLGVLYSSQNNFDRAIDLYSKAIEANPQLAEAHYRLGVAYDRLGEQAKARQEFLLHDQIKKREADAVERQRREVKQFLVVVQGQSVVPAAK